MALMMLSEKDIPVKSIKEDMTNHVNLLFIQNNLSLLKSLI